MRDIENISISQGETLNVSGTTTLGRHFPLAQGWHKLMIAFNVAVTIGTGTGAIADGLQRLVKRVLLRTDRGEIICNACGRFLAIVENAKTGTTPYNDTLAAASATYTQYLTIFFSDPRLLRPVDTILDTARYNNLSLEITLGTVADLFTSVGTSSIAVTTDIVVNRTREVLPPEARPLFYVSYENAQPTPAANAFIDIDRAPDLAIKRLYIAATTDGTAGEQWSGTFVNTIQNRCSVKDSSSYYIQDRLDEGVRADNKTHYAFETIKTGIQIHSFTSDDSVNSALYTGDKSKLQYVWDNQALGGLTTPQVCLSWEGVRGLK